MDFIAIYKVSAEGRPGQNGHYHLRTMTFGADYWADALGSALKAQEIVKGTLHSLEIAES